jgi:NADH-quinone oxidoreductase subunit J
MPLPVLAADPSGSWLASIQGLAGLWPLWLPLLAGGLAVFWLLPRPSPYPWAWGAMAGVLALALGAVHLVRAAELNVETVLFYVFSALAVGSGALLVTQRNPARAALSFALVVLSTCGLFLLLAAPFLMAATIIVYAGAIVVTFLFVLMLAQPEGLSSADARSREPLLATLTGFVLLGALLYVLQLGYDTREFDSLLYKVREAQAKEDPRAMQILVSGEEPNEDLFEQNSRLMGAKGMKDLRDRADALATDWSITDPDRPDAQRALLRKFESLLMEARERVGTVQPAPNSPLSSLSGTPASTPYAEVRRDEKTRLPELPADNSAYLGRALFTDFLLPVELGGTLLLVATIGAIAIGQRHSGR